MTPPGHSQPSPRGDHSCAEGFPRRRTWPLYASRVDRGAGPEGHEGWPGGV